MLDVMRVGVALLALAASAASATADELFVPAAVHRQGPDGAWWNTEVWVSNTTAAVAGYGCVFLPANRPSNLEELRLELALVDVGPRATVFRNDLVPEGLSGALRCVTTPGVVIYARQANAAGKASSALGMPALSRNGAIRPGEVANLVGLRRTPQYRTVVGIVNPTPEPAAVQVRLYSQAGDLVHEYTYQVGAGVVLQLEEMLHAFGVVRAENMRAELSASSPFFTYASVIDARSGAPTLILPLR